MSDKTILEPSIAYKEPEKQATATPVPNPKTGAATPAANMVGQKPKHGLSNNEKVLVGAAVLSGVGLGAIAYGMDSKGEPVPIADAEQALIKEQATLSTAVNDQMGFKEAFDGARAEVGPGGFFEWNGQIYNTYTEGEWTSMSDEQHQQYLVSLGDNVPESHHAPAQHQPAPQHDRPYEATPTSNEAHESGARGQFVNQPYQENTPDEGGHSMGDLDVHRSKGVDISQDGVVDGIILDLDGDAAVEAVVVDTDADQVYDAVLLDTDNDNDLDSGAQLHADGTIGPLVELGEDIQTPSFDQFPTVGNPGSGPENIKTEGDYEGPPAPSTQQDNSGVETDYTDSGTGAKSLYDSVASSPDTPLEDTDYDNFEEPQDDFIEEDTAPSFDDDTAWT